MSADLDNLKEQAKNLEACLEHLRQNIESFPDAREALWLETLMVSSLRALRTHIKELEKLEYRSPMQNTLWKR